ncbi:glyoxylate/hydroxypyruvate reductase A [Sphingobacterium sp. N143]|uniref:2-hydroxyacid dehydrogenase n=1 Tax=Sphingobacterium sp. N143 TaxID=2746727 RepID=UPI002578D5E1|nr:glyoxylate/hydroxypyruvate reductase A [Sphingobacterium sp. N143]MDM1296256.1 glyoxylate/hydroxypyruvate reductase A [Sphingobacterium sp. N143]
MSIALEINSKRSGDWRDELLKLLPGTKIEIYPDIENPNEVEFILCWKPAPAYYKRFPNLKVVQSAGAGIDHLFPESLPEHISVSKIVDPVLKEDMFEHVLTCLMNGMKNFASYAQNKSNKQWNPLAYMTIDQTKVAILGLGEIGGYVAEKLAGMGFDVKGWSNSKKNIPGVESFVGLDELGSAIDAVDFVVNILPLTTQTENILNRDVFKLFKSGSILINVGRGGHVVEDALLEAIENKVIKAAYLDVFHHEPLPEDHLFWDCAPIFITPHVASRTNIASSVKQVVDNYKRMLHHQSLLNEVSLKKGY